MSQHKNISDNTKAETSKLMKISDTYRASRNLGITWCAALIGISLIILQDYISIGITDIPIFVSLIAFSLALPLLAGTILFFQIEIYLGYVLFKGNKPKFGRFSLTIYYLGAVSAIIGIDAAIWHLTWIAGVWFLFVSFATYFSLGNKVPKLNDVQQLKREEAEKEQALE